GDDANLPWQRRQRPFAGGLEESFRLESLLHLVERQLQRAESLRLQMLADDLVLAFGLVHGNLAAGDDAKAVGGLEFEVAQRRSKHEAAYLRGRVFQREEKVSGVPDLAVRQFAFDPDLEEITLEAIANLDGEVGHAQHAPRRNGRRRGLGLRLVFLERQVEEVRHC